MFDVLSLGARVVGAAVDAVTGNDDPKPKPSGDGPPAPPSKSDTKSEAKPTSGSSSKTEKRKSEPVKKDTGFDPLTLVPGYREVKTVADVAGTALDVAGDVAGGVLDFAGGLFGGGSKDIAPAAKISAKKPTGGADDAAAGSATSTYGTRDGSNAGRRDLTIQDLQDDIRELGIKQTVLDVGSAFLPFGSLFAKPVLQFATGNDMAEDEAAKKDELEEQTTLNFLAETMYALGAPMSVVNALDGGRKIDVVPDSELESDAAYDPKTGALLVSESVYDEAKENKEQLQEQGIVREDGSIVDPTRLDRSSIGDDTAKIATLIGAHENQHGIQDENGVIDQYEKEARALWARFDDASKTMDIPDMAAYVTEAEGAIERLRISMLEYPSYNAQETIQLQAGAPGKLQLTLTADGTSLPKSEAVENIYAFENDLAIPYGASAGKRKSDFTENDLGGFLGAIVKAMRAAAEAGTSPSPTAGASTTTGGGATAATGSDTVPQTPVAPGLPGGKFPGGKFPGEEIPGGKFPGGKFPGFVIGGHFDGDGHDHPRT